VTKSRLSDILNAFILYLPINLVVEPSRYISSTRTLMGRKRNEYVCWFTLVWFSYYKKIFKENHLL